MSNADEDEVEDELEAMERELNPEVEEPVGKEDELRRLKAPKTAPEFTPEEKAQMAKDRAARRARERAAEQASQPMLA